MEIDDPTRKDLSARVIDIVAPIGKGQRRTHIPPESMFGVLICPEFGISARFLEPWDPEEKARKDVGRCLCRRVRGLGTGGPITTSRTSFKASAPSESAPTESSEPFPPLDRMRRERAVSLVAGIRLPEWQSELGGD